MGVRRRTFKKPARKGRTGRPSLRGVAWKALKSLERMSETAVALARLSATRRERCVPVVRRDMLRVPGPCRGGNGALGRRVVRVESNVEYDGRARRGSEVAGG